MYRGEPQAKPGIATSRRNFLAGGLLVGSTMAALFSTRRVEAQGINTGPEPGCSPSGNQPNKCVCLLAGTRIQTPNGQVPIESLRIGDLVTTVSGASKPVKWIGRMRFTREPRGAWRSDVVPVKIARFALNGETPHKELFLSPAHALYFNGLLIPVKHLINRHSITEYQSSDLYILQYYHVELSSHDVIFAEGAPVETYQANANRQAFDNAEEYFERYGVEDSPMAPFAPIISLNGGRQELWSRIRSVVSPIYDRRRPLDVIRDEIADRAEYRNAA